MPEPEQIPLTREFVADAGFWWRAAIAMTVQSILGRPVSWIFLGALVGLLLLLASEGDRLFTVGLVIGGVVLAFATLAVSFRKQYAAGTTMRSGFGTESFVVEQPKSTTRLDYDFYKAARRRGSLVMMKLSRTRWVPYPGALFSDEDVARFNPPETR